jgi:N4-gp56 family major capsid protein
MAAQTTATLTQPMMTYYEAVFLKRSKAALIHAQGAQEKTHESNSGKTIQFTRFSPLAAATTALTEGSNPSEVNLSASNVSATLAEYGNVTKYSKLYAATTIDSGLEEATSIIGQNMGETLDVLVREELYTGATVRLANGRAGVANILATDVLNYTEVKKAVRDLRNASAMTYSDGFFMGKVNPSTEMDLIGDSAWVSVNTYNQGGNPIYNSEIGRLGGVRFVTGTQGKTEASTVTVHSTFIHGANAFGTIKLSSDLPKLYIKNPGEQDTSNPTNRYSTISWAGSFVCKTLVGAWIVNVKTGVTA